MWDTLPLTALPMVAMGDVTGVHNSEGILNWAPVERFWTVNKAHAGAIIYYSRAFAITITLALGVLVFAYARQLFGARAGLFAVALYAVEPNLLAHGRLVLNDVPSAGTYLLFFAVSGCYWRNRTWLTAALVGVATGLALVTKFSMVVLLPVLVVGAVLNLARARPPLETRRKLVGHAGLCLVAMLIVINAAYLFINTPLSAYEVDLIHQNSPGWSKSLLASFRVGSIFMPSQFLIGIYSVFLHTQDGNPAALLGQYGSQGWWYYFPVAFALKTSLPFLLLSCGSVGWAVWQLLAKRDLRFLWLLGPVALYLVVAMHSHLNIGIRHVLPVFPFLLIAGGALLDQLLVAHGRRALHVAVVVATLGWATVEAVHAFPDYIPYMNQLATGHPRWWYLSDSNVEFGDDLPALAEYLHRHGQHSVYGALSAGWALSLYGIQYHEIWWRPGSGKQEPRRYVAIGASFLNGSTSDPPPDERGNPVPEDVRINYYSNYRDRKPEAIFGGSIYLFREQ
jgi:hypothetical protein